jgi:hypothetical protein
MITILDKSLSNNVYEQGQIGRLFVKAETDTSNIITYRWYTASAPSVTISTKSFLNIHNYTPNSWSAGGGVYSVEISDTVTTQTISFSIELKKAQPSPKSDEALLPYKDPKDSGDLAAPSHLTQQINHTKGGFHLYNNLEEMLDASSNFQRLQYGQYAYFKFSDSSVNFIDGSQQDVTLIDKVYRFIVLDPKQRFIDFNQKYVDYDSWNLYIDNKFISPVHNAKTWKNTVPGTGQNVKTQITLDSEGYLQVFDTNNPNSSVKILQGGSNYANAGVVDIDGYDLPNATYALIYTNDFAYLAPITVTVVNGVVTRLQSTEVMGPFLHQPKISFLTGEYTYDTTIDPIRFQWVLDSDWEEKVFLNCVPDNITTTIVNGKLSASVTAAESLWTDPTPALNVITPTYDMTKLVGHNAIKVLEDVIYPYQNVTINLTAFNNASPVDTLIENGNTITITRVFAEIKNYENLLNNSFVKLSGVYSTPGSNQSITELVAISKDTIVANNGFVNFTVGIISHPLSINNVEGYSVTLSAGGKEYGENFDGETNTHNVYGQQQIDWAHRIYYFKDSNASITGNLSIPVNAGRTEPTLSPKGVYAYPRTDTPEYVWLFVPSTITLTEIGLPEENIPFYQYATQDGNKFLTTTVNITVGSKQYTYKGYRSYNKTASDVNVTIL